MTTIRILCIKNRDPKAILYLFLLFKFRYRLPMLFLVVSCPKTSFGQVNKT